MTNEDVTLRLRLKTRKGPGKTPDPFLRGQRENTILRLPDPNWTPKLFLLRKNLDGIPYLLGPKMGGVQFKAFPQMKKGQIFVYQMS